MSTFLLIQSLFELVANDNRYVAKLFKPESHHNFLQEVNTLRELNHPNIVQIVHSQASTNDAVRLWNGDMILFHYEENGSLNEYVPLNGRLTEDVARVIFVQMINALKYAANK